MSGRDTSRGAARRASVSWFVGLAALLVIARASAEPGETAARSEARALGYTGVEAYQAGDYPAAREKLERSFQLFPIPSLGLWSARALVKSGMWVDAIERYRQVAELPFELGNTTVQQAAKADSAREVAELLPRIPSITIRIVDAVPGEVEVTLDGARIDTTAVGTPVLVNPGKHEVVGHYAEQHSSISMSLNESQHEEAVLRFMPAPEGRPAQAPIVATALAAPASAAPAVAAPIPVGHEPAAPDAEARHAWRTAAWVSLGVGGAGLATGVVAYFIGKAKYNELQKNPTCGTDVCGPSARDEVERYDPIRTVHLVGLIAGGVFTAAGITGWVATREPETGVAVRLGPGSATLTATF
jgi:hypothetical protein